MTQTRMAGETPTSSPPLSRLLLHTAEVLRAVRAGQSLTTALAACPGALRAGVQALSFDTMRALGLADAIRRQLVRRAPDARVDALLTVALALLRDPERAPYPAHTLVDQAVQAAKSWAAPQASLASRGPFVNAVLRRFLREREALLAAGARDPVAQWNHPRWWIERVREDWPAQWQDLLRANNEHPPMALRVNVRRTSPQAYGERLAAQGLTARRVGPSGVILDQPRPVQELPGFAAGEVSVQDVAAQWAAPLLLGDAATGPAPLRVLDACAAPGGKTAHLLELADIEVDAIDSDEQRLQRVRDNLERLGLRAARLIAADARAPATFWDGRRYDRILLDAPCTASGIVRRHPDVRWLRREADIAQLARTQRELLDALWPLLQPGGRLLYCTCSVFRAEGADQLGAFLARRPDALALGAPGHALPGQGVAFDREHLGASVDPGDHDGFFYALIEKRSELRAEI